MLIFKKEQIKAMIDHAYERYPHECCGIIAGNNTADKNQHVERVIRVKNELLSSVEYSMDNARLKQVLDELDKETLDFIGVYHSHPMSRAYPSTIDISKANLPEIDYVIISLLDTDNPEIKNFRIVDNKVCEEEVKVEG